jgi:hypothetical protein
MNILLKSIPFLLVALSLSACTGYGVTFQSAPSTQLFDCDELLTGDWRVIEADANTPNRKEFLSINPTCSQIVTITSNASPGKIENKVDNLSDKQDLRIQFTSVGDQRYVVVTPKETSFVIYQEENSKVGVTLPSGKIIWKVSKINNELIVSTVDLDKTAQLILQKKIDGQLYIDRGNKSPNKTSNIYVRGDEKQIASYLSTLDIYSDEQLKLVPATRAEIKTIHTAIKKNGSKK